jgi:hypothetical protein
VITCEPSRSTTAKSPPKVRLDLANRIDVHEHGPIEANELAGRQSRFDGVNRSTSWWSAAVSLGGIFGTPRGKA